MDKSNVNLKINSINKNTTSILIHTTKKHAKQINLSSGAGEVLNSFLKYGFNNDFDDSLNLKEQTLLYSVLEPYLNDNLLTKNEILEIMDIYSVSQAHYSFMYESNSDYIYGNDSKNLQKCINKGGKIIPFLTVLLELAEKRPETKINADTLIYILGCMGPKARSVAPLIRQRINSLIITPPYWPNRSPAYQSGILAAEALSKIGGPELEKSMEETYNIYKVESRKSDKDTDKLGRAIAFLGGFGPSAYKYSPLLADMVWQSKDKKTDIRTWALCSLKKIGGAFTTEVAEGLFQDLVFANLKIDPKKPYEYSREISSLERDLQNLGIHTFKLCIKKIKKRGPFERNSRLVTIKFLFENYISQNSYAFEYPQMHQGLIFKNFNSSDYDLIKKSIRIMKDIADNPDEDPVVRSEIKKYLRLYKNRLTQN